MCSELPICTYLANPTFLNIEHNAPGCNSPNEVLENCVLSTDFNTITGNISYDLDANGCDTSDISLELLDVINTDGTTTTSTYTNTAGEYFFFVAEGTYTTSIAIDESVFSIRPNKWTINNLY